MKDRPAPNDYPFAGSAGAEVGRLRAENAALRKALAHLEAVLLATRSRRGDEDDALEMAARVLGPGRVR